MPLLPNDYRPEYIPAEMKDVHPAQEERSAPLFRPFKVSHVRRDGWQASFDRPPVEEKKEREEIKAEVEAELWLFQRAHISQQDSLEEANYKFDNTSGTLE